MNMLKTAAIATAFAASLIPLSAMAVNQPLICMGQRIDVGATYAELVQSCGKPLNLTDRRGPCTQLPDPGQWQHQCHRKRQRARHKDREGQVGSRQQSESGSNRYKRLTVYYIIFRPESAGSHAGSGFRAFSCLCPG